MEHPDVLLPPQVRLAGPRGQVYLDDERVALLTGIGARSELARNRGQLINVEKAVEELVKGDGVLGGQSAVGRVGHIAGIG